MIAVVWIMAVGVYGLGMYRAVRLEDRMAAAAEAERQAERERRLAVMRGAAWAWDQTPEEMRVAS